MYVVEKTHVLRKWERIILGYRNHSCLRTHTSYIIAFAVAFAIAFILCQLCSIDPIRFMSFLSFPSLPVAEILVAISTQQLATHLGAYFTAHVGFENIFCSPYSIAPSSIPGRHIAAATSRTKSQVSNKGCVDIRVPCSMFLISSG